MSKERSGVFCSRNFRLAFLGALVSELGALMYSFAVSFYILQISDNSAFLQGLYLALCGVAMLLSTPVGGVLGDRFNKAKIMYLCDFVKGGVIIAATVLMMLFQQSPAQIAILFALGIISDIVSGLFFPAANSLIPDIVEEQHLQQANSFLSMKSSLENIFGIVMAGVLYSVLPIHTLFYGIGGCFIISGISELLIVCPHNPPKESLTLRAAFRDMSDGFAYLKDHRGILTLLGSMLFINFFLSPLSSNFLPFFVSTDVAGSESYLLHGLLSPELWSSVIGVCFGVGSLAGAAVLGMKKQKDKCGREVSIRLSVMAAVILAAFLSYWLLVKVNGLLNGFLPLFCAECIALGWLISYVNIPISTTIMRTVDRDMLSKVNSMLSIGSQGMIPIASVLAGTILQTGGSSALLLFCALGFAVTAACLLFNKNIREF